MHKSCSRFSHSESQRGCSQTFSPGTVSSGSAGNISKEKIIQVLSSFGSRSLVTNFINESELSMINFKNNVLLTRVARSPYIAKKYGHLLDGYEFYDEIKTYKVNFKLSNNVIP